MVLNSLPQATKPDAVYGTKKTTMTRAPMVSISLVLSRKRRARKSGTVMASTFAE